MASWGAKGLAHLCHPVINRWLSLAPRSKDLPTLCPQGLGHLRNINQMSAESGQTTTSKARSEARADASLAVSGTMPSSQTPALAFRAKQTSQVWKEQCSCLEKPNSFLMGICTT